MYLFFFFLLDGAYLLYLQVCLTAYVFLLTLPENTLWIPTALVFTAGIIKFAERTRSLQLASVGHFRQSIVRKPDPGPNYAKLMEELKSRVDAGLPTEIVTMPEISDDPFLDIDEPETSGGNPDHEHPKTDDEVVGAINNTSQQSDKPEPHANDNAQDQPNSKTSIIQVLAHQQKKKIFTISFNKEFYVYVGKKVLYMRSRKARDKFF